MTSPNNSSDFTAPLIKAYEDAQAWVSSYWGAASKSQSAALQGLGDIARNVNDLVQGSVARTVDAYKTLAKVKTPQEAAETHTAFFRDLFDRVVAGGGKLSEISLHTAKSTVEPLTQHATETVGAIIKKATKA